MVGKRKQKMGTKKREGTEETGDMNARFGRRKQKNQKTKDSAKKRGGCEKGNAGKGRLEIRAGENMDAPIKEKVKIKMHGKRESAFNYRKKVNQGGGKIGRCE